MFFEEDRIAAFREMICADTAAEREAALDKILPYQQGDFEALFAAMEGNPVNIRFLDPPLHEFLPTEEEDIRRLADAQGKTIAQIKQIIASLHEFNPMLGHRGLPACHHLSGDPAHADARSHPCGAQRTEAAP